MTLDFWGNDQPFFKGQKETPGRFAWFAEKKKGTPKKAREREKKKERGGVSILGKCLTRCFHTPAFEKELAAGGFDSLKKTPGVSQRDP